MTVTLETVTISDPGCDTEPNEDSIALVIPEVRQRDEPAGLLVLADGLGGHQAGDVASRMVTTQIPGLVFTNRSVHPFERLQNAVNEVNKNVHTEGRQSIDLEGMCATVVSCLFVKDRIMFIHVGDSRAYLIRGGKIIHRTKDHVLEQPAYPSVQSKYALSHVLTQSIGHRPVVFPDASIHEIRQHDVVLLCSDGLSDTVSDGEITDIVSSRDLSTTADQLVSLARHNGSRDDASLIIARVTSPCSIGIEDAP